MDTFTLNKIAGAVLGTLTVLLGVNVLVEEVFHEKPPAKPGYEVAAKKEGGDKAAAPAASGAVALLAKADPAKGEQAVKKCAACHGFEKGGPAKAGPNLYGVVGGKHAHQEGFGYSEGMKKSGGNWDFASMDKWLENPKGYIQGTSMSFAGVKSPEERANIIAYLNKNSDKPLPLPKEGEGAAPAAAGGAGGGFEAKVAAADPKKGEQAVKKCAACHGFEKGGPAKAGPNLYGVVGGKHAHQEGFGYSDAMKKTSDKVWDVENMNKWLENPKGYIQGTSMSFAGVKNEDERASIIAYLNKNSDKPVELKSGGGGEKQVAAGGAPAAAGGGGDVAAKVASADVKKGEQAAKKCAACHGFEKGGPAKAGPNLYGIVGLKHAHMEGFGYSEAMKKTSDKVWDVANLDKWLENPKGYIQGTSMSFAGVKNADERAALIAYLNKNSDKPQDLGGGEKKPEGAAPAPAPAAAPAPAEGGKKTEAAPPAPAPAPAEDKKAEAPAAPAPAAPAPAPAEEKKAEAPAPAPAAAPAPEGGEKTTEAAPPPPAPAPAEDKKAEAPAAPAPAEEKKAEAPAQPAATPAAPAPAAAGGEIDKLLASADPAKGESFFKENCGVCHTYNKGGEAGAGPNLYGIVGLKHGHMEGFEYSDALKGKQGNWDFAQLDQWLKKPEEYAPGTMMAYPGIDDAQERANVIAFLNKNSDSPAPIPGK